MYIKKIVLENIRSYTRQCIEFPHSSVMLSGDIGSGKSTILQAIEFALFGLKRKHLPGLSLLRNGEKKGSVELNFKIGTKEIIVKRTLKRQKKDVKQTEGYIIIDGKKQDLTPVELKSRILDLLNYPGDLVARSKDVIYRYTIYTPQEEMKRILTEDSESRLNTLRKVFDIEKYKQIRENSSITISYLKQECDKITGFVSDIDQKKKQKSEADASKYDMIKRLDILKKSFLEIDKKIKTQKHFILETEKKLKRFNDLNNKLEITFVKLDDLVNRQDNFSDEKKIILKQLDNLKQRYDNIKTHDISDTDIGGADKEISIIEQKIFMKAKARDELDIKLKAVDDKIEMIRKDVDEQKVKDLPLLESEIVNLNESICRKKDFVQKLSEYETELDDLLEKKHKLGFQINDSKNIVEKVTKLSNCPTCLQPVADEHKIRLKTREKDRQLEYLAIMENIAKDEHILRQGIAKLKDDIENIRKAEHKLIGLKNRKKHLEEYSDAIIRKKRILDSLKSKRTVFKKKIEDADLENVDALRRDLKQKKQLLEKLRENKMLKLEKNNISHMIKDKASRLEELDVLIKKTSIEKKTLEENRVQFLHLLKDLKNINIIYEKQNSLLDSLLDQHKEKELEISVVRTRLNSVQENIQSLQKEIIEKSEKRSLLNYYLQIQNWLQNHFKELMFSIEKQILLKAYYEFNSYFQRWFSLLMEDDAMSVRLDDDFSVIVEQNGFDTTYNHLSGGEKTSCALAYRLALNKVINEINSSIMTKNLIMLDEPTDGFSSEQLDKMRNVLDEIGIKQIILVSHENKIESFVSKVIKVAKANHVSKVISV